jgi:hypothetical protein
MKTFWQHRNGKLYALKHDTFGHIIGVWGPFDGEDACAENDDLCGAELAVWAEDEIRHHAMHRLQPAMVA